MFTVLETFHKMDTYSELNDPFFSIILTLTSKVTRSLNESESLIICIYTCWLHLTVNFILKKCLIKVNV